MKLTSVRALQHVTLSVEGVDVATSMAEVATPTPDPDILHIPQLSVEVCLVLGAVQIGSDPGYHSNFYPYLEIAIELTL